MSPPSHHVSGLDTILDGQVLLDAPRPLLLTHEAAVTADLRRGIDALVEAGHRPHALLAPEHGYWGTGQAGAGGTETVDLATGVPVRSSYGISGTDLDRLIAGSGAGSLLVDLQDIGCRFYTYLWSMSDAMASCARLGLPVIVLDRPAPLPATALGPGVAAEAASFVGRHDVPLRHGARLGDLARHLARHDLDGDLDLTVVPAPIADGAAPWVPTSPNMPTRSTVALYPGTGLVEGTTWNEGRGTTLPFELLGAPWAGPDFAHRLRELSPDGVIVREAVYVPTSGDHAGQRVVGAQLHLAEDPVRLVADPQARFDPLRLAHAVLSVMRDLTPTGALWRAPHPGRVPFIDLLWGSSALREGIDDRASLEEILDASPSPPAIERTEPADPGMQRSAS